jgi:hypothetical protein
MKVRSVCQVKSNTQDKGNIPIPIMNNIEINKSVFMCQVHNLMYNTKITSLKQ